MLNLERIDTAVSRMFSPRSNQLSQDAPGWNWFYSMLAGKMKSASGVMVSPESAMRNSTVMACVRVLAETLAQLPKVVYETSPNGRRSTDSKHALNIIFSETPNTWQTAYEFVEMMQGHLALRGNAYAQIVPGELGAVTQLIPLLPDRMVPKRLGNYQLFYEYTEPNGQKTTYTQDQIFHLRGLSTDGLMGLSPLATARDTFGNALAQERYQGKMFSNRVQPSGYLKGGAAVKQADAALMQQSLMEAYAGEDNWHKPMVTWGGIEWAQLGMTNLDAQFIEQMKYSANEICKVFRMQPHMVGILDKATFSNIEQQSLEFVLYTILPWVRRWEEAIQRDLISDRDHSLKFNLRGLMRGDNAARAAYYKDMVFSGLMSPNEVRELEDFDPYPGGDEFFMQTAMTTVDLIVNPPVPLPPPPVDTKAADDKSQADAIAKGELKGQVEVFKIQLTSATAELAVRDQMLAEAQQLAGAAAAELKARQLEYETATADCRVESERLVLAAQEKLTEQQGEVELLLVRVKESEKALALARSESSEVRKQADDAQEKIKAAIENNSSRILACAKRLLVAEVDGVLKILNRRNGIAALESFYHKHAAKMLTAIEPLIVQRLLLCQCVESDAMIASHIAESKALLLAAFKGPAETSADRIKECLAGWSERAASVIESLNQKEANHAET